MANATPSIIPLGRLTYMNREHRAFFVGGSDNVSSYYVISRKTLVSPSRDYILEYALFATREEFGNVWNEQRSEALETGLYNQDLFTGPSLAILLNEYLRPEDLGNATGGTDDNGNPVLVNAGDATAANQQTQSQLLQGIYERLQALLAQGTKETPVVNGSTPLKVEATLTGTPSVRVENFPTQPTVQQVRVTNEQLQVSLPTSPLEVVVTNQAPAPAEQQIKGEVTIANFPVFPATQQIAGNVVVTSLPPIGGTVAVNNFPAKQVVVVDNLPVIQQVTGTLNIGNFPAKQEVSGELTIKGEVAVKAGTEPLQVTVTNPSSSVGGATEARQQQQLAELQGISQKLTSPVRVVVDNPTAAPSTVAISNFPATQTVQGNVNATVTNFPATQQVGGMVSASITNFPTTQAVSGTVNIGNYPATQAVSVSGEVAVKAGTAPLSVTVTNPVSTVAISSLPEVEIKNDVGNPVPVVQASQPLPTGAATAAKQDGLLAGQTSMQISLSSIDQKLTPPLQVTGNLTSTPEVFASKVFTAQLLAASNGFVVKAAPGVIKRLLVGTTASASRYVQVYNKATAPVATDVPIAIVVIPSAPTPSQQLDLNINCSQGIYLTIGNQISLVGTLLTALGANDCVVTALYT